MFDLVSMGEILIDFTPVQLPGHNPCYEQQPGGAPANVACALAKFGRKTAFLGKVGMDQFGRFCQKALINAGVNTDGLLLSADYPTTLAFVHLDEGGDRTFSFYRHGMADVNVHFEEIPNGYLDDTRFFHFGSVSTTEEPARSATFACVRQAKQSGAVISYDPNLRPPLWESMQLARETILSALPLADILKMSIEEVEFLFGNIPPHKAALALCSQYGISLALISLGAKGCLAAVGGKLYTAPTYDVKTVDTTGCGDSFLAGVLHKLITYDTAPDNLLPEQVGSMLSFANALGSLVSTKRGAIPALPTEAEIESCIRSCKLLAV